MLSTFYTNVDLYDTEKLCLSSSALVSTLNKKTPRDSHTIGIIEKWRIISLKQKATIKMGIQLLTIGSVSNWLTISLFINRVCRFEVS